MHFKGKVRQKLNIISVDCTDDDADYSTLASNHLLNVMILPI